MAGAIVRWRWPLTVANMRAKLCMSSPRQLLELRCW